MLSEWEKQLPSDAPFRQGDVVAWGDWSTRAPWNRFRVIITADCDIAQDKIGGTLITLPVIDVATYLGDVWAKTRLERFWRSHLERLIDRFHKHHLRLNDRATRLKPEDIEEWLSRDSEVEICDALSVADTKERVALSEDIKHANSMRSALQTAETAQLIQALCIQTEAKSKLAPERARENVLRDAQSDLSRNLPADCFLLTTLPQVDVSGAVCMLRHIAPLEMSRLTVSYSEARSRPELAFRLGRLSPTLKYALAQKFATLFARVGLPAEYEKWQRETIEFCCELTFPEGKGAAS